MTARGEMTIDLTQMFVNQGAQVRVRFWDDHRVCYDMLVAQVGDGAVSGLSVTHTPVTLRLTWLQDAELISVVNGLPDM